MERGTGAKNVGRSTHSSPKSNPTLLFRSRGRAIKKLNWVDPVSADEASLPEYLYHFRTLLDVSLQLWRLITPRVPTC